MSRLAAYLRARARDDVLRLSAADRMQLALSLGDDDLQVFCAATGIGAGAARRRLRAARQRGRCRSRAAAVSE